MKKVKSKKAKGKKRNAMTQGKRSGKGFSGLPFYFLLFTFALVIGPARADWKEDWEKTLRAAKEEGKVVAGIPASSELRTAIDARFKDRFGIQTELFPARGPQNATRIITEVKAGVAYFDLLLAGGATPLAMVSAGVTQPFEPAMILPEVKEEKNWWGGHIWEDNVSGQRHIYAFQCYSSETLWHNSDVVRPGELRSFDDLLDPKWKGKIGLLDPRNPGSGQNTWAFLWKVKGEDFLKKLAQQEILVAKDQRQMADALAKGKLAITIGLTYYTLQPYIKAGLPMKPVSAVREGNDASNGSGVVTLVKNAPHPNAAKVFVNWLLSKEGQELYGKAVIQGTRRLDVDTRWLKDYGIEACKENMTVEDYHRNEVHLESSVIKVRQPAIDLAKKVLK